jgi:hypothetical protein
MGDLFIPIDVDFLEIQSIINNGCVFINRYCWTVIGKIRLWNGVLLIDLTLMYFEN